MDFLKALFEGKDALSWDEFSAAVEAKGYKLADLASGKYVAKKKFDDELASKDSMIEDLNSQITKRDTDLEALKVQLENGTQDSNAKVADLTTQLSKLQSDYESSKAEYETKLSRQAYEFAVNEYTNGLKFTSEAAKRDFRGQMLSADLKIKDKQLIGADDFKAAYAKDNADAFPVENPEPDPAPAPEGPKPMFVQPTPAASQPKANPFVEAFNFAP